MMKDRELWRKTRSVFLAFVFSRLLILAVVTLSPSAMKPGDIKQPYYRPANSSHWLQSLTHWDGVWYRLVAEEGYASAANPRGDPKMNAAFFPFYPACVRALAVVVRDYRAASLLVSNGFLFIAGLLLQALMRREFQDERYAHRALVFLMFSPVSFFFSSAYPESVHLALALGAMLAAINRRWLLACLCGMALSATKPNGVLILLPLFLEHLRGDENGAGWRSLVRPRILLFALVPLGLGLYGWHCYRIFGDPLAFSHAQINGWGRAFRPPWYPFTHLEPFSLFYRVLFLGLLMTAATLCLAGWRLKIRLSLLVYAATLILFNLCWGTMDAMPRQLSIVFPLYVFLGALTTRVPLLYEPLLAGSVALLTFCTALTANDYWMA